MITHTVQGVTYARQADVLDQLGADVTPAMLRMWVKRKGLRRIHPGRPGTEPWYDLDAAIDIEHETRISGHGRPRKGNAR